MGPLKALTVVGPGQSLTHGCLQSHGCLVWVSVNLRCIFSRGQRPWESEDPYFPRPGSPGPAPPAGMLAEIVKLFRPLLEDLHNCVPTCNTPRSLATGACLTGRAPRATQAS